MEGIEEFRDDPGATWYLKPDPSGQYELSGAVFQAANGESLISSTALGACAWKSNFLRRPSTETKRSVREIALQTSLSLVKQR